MWRASQLARGIGNYVPCGYTGLAAELPGGGWPAGALTELFIEQCGSAELQLLRPALSSLDKGPIIFLQTPNQPQALAMAGLGLDLHRLLWLRCKKTPDALWAAEQILRSGSCAALLFWQSQIKVESLRRLHLAAQNGRTLFCVIRPTQFAQNPSPAILRIQIALAQRGLQLTFIKRRGAQKHEALFLPISAPPSLFSRTHLSSDTSVFKNNTELVDSRSLATIAPRSISPSLVG